MSLFHPSIALRLIRERPIVTINLRTQHWYRVLPRFHEQVS